MGFVVGQGARVLHPGVMVNVVTTKVYQSVKGYVKVLAVVVVNVCRTLVPSPDSGSTILNRTPVEVTFTVFVSVPDTVGVVVRE